MADMLRDLLADSRLLPGVFVVMAALLGLAVAGALRYWRLARHAAARLEALQASMPVGVAFVDNDGRYVSINAYMAAINGVPAAAHVGRHFSEILPPAPAELFRTIRDQIHLTGEGVFNLPLSEPQPGDDPAIARHLMMNFFPVRLDGAVVGIGGTIVDVTAERQAEAVIRKEGEEFRLLAENLTVKVWRLTPPDGFRYCNPAAMAYSGLGAATWQGSNWREIIHPDDLAAFYGRWLQARETGETFVAEGRLQRASDGMYRWHLLHATPIRDAQGQIGEWLATGADIHDQKVALAERDDLIVQLQQAEAEQRQLADDFRLLADMVPHIIWTKSAPDATDFINRRGLDYAGLLSAVRTTAESLQLVHPDDMDKRRAWERALADGVACTVEARMRRHDGVHRWHLIQTLPVRDHKGRIVRWIGCATDIDDHKQALLVRETFLSVASHELKTPITALLLQLHVLKRRLGDADPALQQRIDVASRHGERLTKLVNNLLDVSRIVSGRFDDPQPVSLREVVDEVVDRFVLDLEETGLDVIEAAPGPLVGIWDRLHVDQILTNLLTNALKYGQGSRITIRLGLDGDEACLDVGDGGPGIAAADLDRIFLQYHRLGSSDGPPGHGLGLWIVQHLVERMGGRVSVRSQPGTGATFAVRLPLNPG
jgi:PAS domain S-box-containing protein